MINKKKKIVKITKKAQEKELKLLKRKCLQLWTAKVKDRAGRKCEVCGKKKRLNSHHAESFSTNKALRYSLENGISVCITCHKFGRFALHKSFCTTFVFMSKKRMSDFEYLLLHYKDKNKEITKEFLLNQIEKLGKE